MLHLLCATNDANLRQVVHRAAVHFGAHVHIAVTLESIRKLVKQFEPSVAMVDLALEPSSVLEMPSMYGGTSWILRMPPDAGWAMSAELSESSHFSEIMLDSISLTNVLEAVGAILERRQACERECAKNSENASVAELSSNESLKTGVLCKSCADSFKGDGIWHALQAWQNQVFGMAFSRPLTTVRERFHGTFSQTPWLSLFYRLFAEKSSGTLHLRRRYLHFTLVFRGGFPVCADTRDASDVLGFEAWDACRCDEARIEDKLPSMRFKLDKGEGLVDSRLFERRRAYICHLIDEIFTWPDARFSFIQGTEKELSSDDPGFSEHDIYAMISHAVFLRIPDAMIHEVTHSALSYFLKLNDNGSGFWGSDFSKKANVVIERLRSGNSLSEMLAMLPDEYPVQRVVYAAAMLNELNWLS